MITRLNEHMLEDGEAGVALFYGQLVLVILLKLPWDVESVLEAEQEVVALIGQEHLGLHLQIYLQAKNASIMY